MRCPFCASDDTQVKDSRPTEENAVIRRRRICPVCGGRFTTFERVQLRELIVVKRSGRKVPFERDKLLRSVEIALRKRPVERERIDRMVSGIVRQLESTGESEISSSTIGELVIETLRGLDPVAYVRFASVYRDFREAADFQEVLSEIAKENGAHPKLASAAPSPAAEPIVLSETKHPV
jgi:transcriptional repressor NrdR